MACQVPDQGLLALSGPSLPHSTEQQGGSVLASATRLANNKAWICRQVFLRHDDEHTGGHNLLLPPCSTAGRAPSSGLIRRLLLALTLGGGGWWGRGAPHPLEPQQPSCGCLSRTGWPGWVSVPG